MKNWYTVSKINRDFLANRGERPDGDVEELHIFNLGSYSNMGDALERIRSESAQRNEEIVGFREEAGGAIRMNVLPFDSKKVIGDGCSQSSSQA